MQPQTADHTNVETGYLALVDRWCMDELTEKTEEWKARVAGNLRLRRRELKLTQEQLAEQAGINYATYRGIEAGHSTLAFDKLVRLSAALQVSPADIFGTELAPLPPRRLIRRDGMVETGDPAGAGYDAFRFFEVEEDMPEFNLRAGDTLVVDTALAEFEIGKLAIVNEDGDLRLHKVVSMNPAQLSRPNGYTVVFNARFHKLVGRIARLQRDDP